MGQGQSNTPLNSVSDDRATVTMTKPVEVAQSPQMQDHHFRGGGPGWSPPPAAVPTVFKWHGGGDAVYVAGDWDNFASKRALVRSDSGKTLIVSIPPGQHRYHFEVDGRWLIDPEKPQTRALNGEAYNLCTAEIVGEFTSSSPAPASSSPPGEYGQEMRDPPLLQDRSKRRGNPNDPPMLPPHLLRALLNTESPSGNPVLLPLPHHVMLNHLYINKSREAEGITIHGVTCRYRSKYVTTVLYRVK